MQNTISVYLLTAAFLLPFSSCDNKLNVAADWEEVAVIYSALNPTDDTNYARIQRAFLDESQSAFKFLNDPDSLYFDTLEVYIEEYSNGNFSKKIDLRLIDGNDVGIEKDTGVFYSDTNPLYFTDEEIRPSTFTTDISYYITVTNPKTGYTCRSSTESVGQAEVYNPINNTSSRTIQPKSNDDNRVYVNFKEGKYVRAYTLDMTIRVEETDTSGAQKKEIKTVNWRMVNLGKTQRIQGFEDKIYLVPSVNFFSALSSQLEANPNIERRLVDYDLTFYGVSDDFNTYLSVSRPSIGIVQKKPEFTNVENGLGLFTSRYITRFENRIFDPSTVTEIQLSETTSNLNFVK